MTNIYNFFKKFGAVMAAGVIAVFALVMVICVNVVTSRASAEETSDPILVAEVTFNGYTSHFYYVADENDCYKEESIKIELHGSIDGYNGYGHYDSTDISYTYTQVDLYRTKYGELMGQIEEIVGCICNNAEAPLSIKLYHDLIIEDDYTWDSLNINGSHVVLDLNGYTLASGRENSCQDGFIQVNNANATCMGFFGDTSLKIINSNATQVGKIIGSDKSIPVINIFSTDSYGLDISPKAPSLLTDTTVEIDSNVMICGTINLEGEQNLIVHDGAVLENKSNSDNVITVSKEGVWDWSDETYETELMYYGVPKVTINGGSVYGNIVKIDESDLTLDAVLTIAEDMIITMDDGHYVSILSPEPTAPKAEYTVVFVYHGQLLNAQMVTEDDYATAPTLTDDPDYTFDGWTVNGVVVEDLSTYAITTNTVFVAQLTPVVTEDPTPEAPVTYTVTFVYQDKIVDTQNVTADGHATAPDLTTVADENYTFDGWLIGGTVKDLATYTVTDHTVCIAKLTKKAPEDSTPNETPNEENPDPNDTPNTDDTPSQDNPADTDQKKDQDDDQNQISLWVPIVSGIGGLFVGGAGVAVLLLLLKRRK